MLYARLSSFPEIVECAIRHSKLLKRQTGAGVIGQMTDEIDLYGGIFRLYAREEAMLSHICNMLLYTTVWN